jgi:hypothetical protein
MEIEITKTFTDPGGNVHIADSIEHVSDSVALTYFEWKVAKRAVYKSLKEAMDAKERQRIAALPPGSALAAGWSLREATGNDPSVRFIVVKTSPTGELTFYDAPPEDAPLKFKQRFADAVATDSAAFSSRAEFLKRQASEPLRTTGYNVGDIAKAVKRG